MSPSCLVTASLHPDPATVDFTADGEEWHRFTVTVTGTDSVQIVVNNLEIHKGHGPEPILLPSGGGGYEDRR